MSDSAISIQTRRSSNIELLRLVCMLMILVGHLYIHSLHNVGIGNPNAEPFPCIIYAFCYCAVNCFVLISGYFSIHISFHKIWKLYSMCAIYGLSAYFIHLFVDDQHIGRSIINNGILPFSAAPGWWFIEQYFLLFLISPILNFIVDNSTKSTFTKFIIILSILNLYFGFARGGNFNKDGYDSICQFSYIYLIGLYLKLYFVPNGRTRYVVAYVICGLVLGSLTILGNKFSINSVLIETQNYNHPIVILESIFLFLSFSSLKIESSVINKLSASTLAAYLITENSYIGHYYYVNFAKLFDDVNPILTFLIILAFSIGTLFVCIGIDKVRIFFLNPIDNLVLNSWKLLRAKINIRI